MFEQYGISVNNDSVVRTAFYKYFHPKEALIDQGVLDPEISRVANGRPKEDRRRQQAQQLISNVSGPREEQIFNVDESQGDLVFVYPFGATINVQEPAFPILSTGPLSYPTGRPIGAIYQHHESGGNLVVLGSYKIFTDDYIEKEQNWRLFVKSFIFHSHFQGIFPKTFQQNC